MIVVYTSFLLLHNKFLISKRIDDKHNLLARYFSESIIDVVKRNMFCLNYGWTGYYLAEFTIPETTKLA